MSELGTAINLSARRFFERHTVSLDWIKLFNALCGEQVDWSLPWGSTLATLAFIALTLFPGALWAGAITPVSSSQTTTGTIQLPAYTNTSWIDSGNTPAPINVDKGIFTFDPGWDLQGLILNSAASASNRTGGPTTHPKLDRTQYSYTNRSYGVGASVGLTSGPLLNKAMRYTYHENGIESSVSCIYNRSSEWQLTPSAGQPSNWFLSVFEAQGPLPNTPPGNRADFVAASIGANPAIVALATDTSNGENYIAITTTGEQYAPLNYTQCQVTFTQRNFSVEVDVQNRTISVAPLNETTWLSNKTVADSVSQLPMGALHHIGVSVSTALYVNGLGNAFIDNIKNMQAARDETDDASTLAGIEAVLTSILDDAMVAFSSAQIMLLNDTSPAPVVVTSAAYAFGTRGYIYAVVCISFLVTAGYIVEAFRTRGWRGLSKFDFMDVKSVIVAASEGGTAIAKEAQDLHHAEGTSWDADADDAIVGRICVRLEKSAGGSGGIAVSLSEREHPVGGGRRRVYTRLADESNEDGSMIALRDTAQPMGESQGQK